jgi:hypothetical protein
MLDSIEWDFAEFGSSGLIYSVSEIVTVVLSETCSWSSWMRDGQNIPYRGKNVE